MRIRSGLGTLYVHEDHLSLISHLNPPVRAGSARMCLTCGAGPFATWEALVEHYQQEHPEREAE